MKKNSASSIDIVRAGYDLVAEAYARAFREEGGDEIRICRSWIELMLEGLDHSPRILELGCGDGVPVARDLAGRSDYLGIDISPVQIARARDRVPNGTFRCDEMSSLQFEPETFDAIVALYSIIHLPRETHASLLRTISTWLRPGGRFLATLGHTAWTGTEENWLGIENGTMFWSHADAATYRQWIEDASIDIVVGEFVPEGTGGHQMFMGVKRTTVP